MTGSGIDVKKLSACIHCGLCLEACPTYRQTGEEMSSPRGRLYLMRNYLEGSIKASDPEFAQHELSCLVCRSCETSCPSGVEFGTLMEQTRAIIADHQNGSSFRKFLYTKVLRSRYILQTIHFILAFASKLGLDQLARKLFPSKSSRIGASLSLLPQNIPFPITRPHIYTSHLPNGKRIGLLLGCIGDVFTSQVNDATIRVLNGLGYEVDIMPNISCCGALAAHAGYIESTKELAHENIKHMQDSNISFVVSNIAGCGAMLKEYDTLLPSPGAAQVCKKIFDINEFLYHHHLSDLRDLLGSSIFSGKRIAYQSPCHLLHGQRIVNEPIELLRLLPGATVFPLEENELCCGSAGSYNIEHPDMAESLRKRKMQIIHDARPDILATANAGCMMQLGKERTVEVRHVIELLAQAIGQGAT